MFKATTICQIIYIPSTCKIYSSLLRSLQRLSFVTALGSGSRSRFHLNYIQRWMRFPWYNPLSTVLLNLRTCELTSDSPLPTSYSDETGLLILQFKNGGKQEAHRNYCCMEFRKSSIAHVASSSIRAYPAASQ